MSTPAVLRAFTLFSNLPIELQDLIWEMTLPGPRAMSAENFFQEWWHHRIASFFAPVALHVSHNSRSFAKRFLRYTSVYTNKYIPGLAGWRTLYVNQASDFFIITRWEVLMNAKIFDFIADTTVISRVMITGPALDEEIISKQKLITYLGQFSGLKEVAFVDRGQPIWHSIDRLPILSKSKPADLGSPREQNSWWDTKS